MDILKKTLGKNQIILKPHQVEAAEWMLNIEQNMAPYGGILADDMGLGKTLEALSIIVTNPVDHTLIIVPSSVLEQWVTEINKFIGYTFVTIDYPSKFKKGITLTTYHKAVKYQSIQNKEWGRVILDEGHIIRNRKTKTFIGLCRLKTKHKWILSGTPIQNSFKDLKTLLTFVGFENDFDLNLKEEYIENIVKTYVMRRTKTEVDLKMPNLKIIKHYIEFENESEKKQYGDETFGLKLSSHNLKSILIKYLRQRQYSLLPKMVFDSYNDEMEETPKLIPKNYKLDKVVETIVKNKDTEKPIVFCHFKKEMKYLQDKLDANFLKAEIINGYVSKTERTAIIARHRKYDVLLIQLMAGSVGLNLQMFNCVIFTAPHWNPTHERQAVCRAYRLGQKRDVTVRRFVFKDTIESYILSRQKLKKKIMMDYNML